MLSKKMTFSLMSLITILALAFVAPSAMAQVKVTVTGLTSVPHAGTADAPAATPVNIVIETDKNAATPALTAKIFNKNGVEDTANAIDPTTAITTTAGMINTGMKHYFTITVPAAAITADTVPLRVVVMIPAIGPSDPSDDTADSEIMYHTITITEIVDTAGHPKVVSIQRLRPGSQTVVAAFQEAILQPKPFNVRIVFTEKWNVDLAKVGDILAVTNGTASDVVAGVPFARVGPDADPPGGVTNDERAQTLRPHPTEGMYWHDNTPASGLAGVARPTHADAAAALAANDLIPLPTGSDDMYHQYRVTITPHQKSEDFDLKISVKGFDDGGSPLRQFYVPVDVGAKPDGREELRLRVKGAERSLTAGYKVTIPADIRIPGGGFLVIAQNAAGSEVIVPPGSKKDAPKATERTPIQMIYNVIEYADLPNLATRFLTGVVVDLESQHAGLVISEVMWGEDVSLTPSSNSQYIELYNPGGDYVTIADKDETPDINEALTLIFYAPNEFKSTRETPFDKDGKRLADGATRMLEDDELPKGVTDRIGTLDAKGAYWSPATKGSSGRSGTTTGELTAGRGEFVNVVPIVSMYRVMAADGTIDAMMGQMEASWMSSEGPKSANFDPLAIGVRHGTPGAATDATVTPADTEAEEKEKADKKAAADKEAADKLANTGTIPTAGHIYISEIMFAGGGTLPQWIEIANGSATEDVNLSGWTLTVANAVADADVSVGASAKFTIPDGTMIDRSRQTGATKTPSTILVVTEAGRNNIDAVSDQVINLKTDNEVDLILAGVTTRKYTLLSSEAFLITLAPPAAPKSTPPAGETTDAKAKRMAMEKQDAEMRKDATDMAGNLGADGTAAWALPMSDEGRSSIIRAHVNVRIGPSEPEDGTMADNWVLAANTAFADATHIRQKTYYGAMTDEGTPGFRAGSALPVELSHFRPVRDKATGQVMITWSTQSELNNAGFFIKRSQQRNGEFKIINATMIAGAGTTSEKQFYTYTDTTAQPNVVYYYQIEDVSLDGNRQTLTRGIRLKGHVGAAGKATTLWGELKTSHE